MSSGKSEPPLPLRKPPGYRDPAAVPIQLPPPRQKAAVKLPPSFQHTKRRRSCCRIFCCCICISIFVLIFVLSVVGFLFYIWYRPRFPEIHLKSVNFTKFNVTNTPDGGPGLDAQSTIDVVIRNPNQNFGIVYDKTHILLNAINGDVNLGEQTLGGFNQAKNNVTTLRFAIRAQREIVDGKSAEELKKGFKNKNLMMNAEIRSGMGFRQSRWSMKPVQVNVDCVGIRFNQRSPPQCRIKLLNWFFIN